MDQRLKIAVCAVAGAVALIASFDILSVVSPGALIGIALGGCIGVVGFAFGPESGGVGVVIGVLLGGFMGSGMHKMNIANEERMLAALEYYKTNRITGQSQDQ